AAGRKANSCRFRPFAWRKGMTTSPGFAGTEESADFMEASLQPMQRRIAAAGLDQRIMGAVLDQAAALQGEDPIRRPHGGEAVRNDKHCASPRDLLHVLLDDALALIVERRGRLVEDQDARIGDERPCDRNPLALAARQRRSAFADDGVVTFGKLQDEVM